MVHVSSCQSDSRDQGAWSARVDYGWCQIALEAVVLFHRQTVLFQRIVQRLNCGMVVPRTICHLPYAHLNLRRNPFGEFSERERTDLAFVNVEAIVERLRHAQRDRRYAVQFVGEKGYGKTTHVLVVRSHFPDAGYVHIAEGERAAIPSGSPVLIDEAQRLTRWQQFRLFRSDAPLVLGTHRDFGLALRRAGRVVETVHVAQTIDADRLTRLLNARIDSVRRSEGCVPSVSRETVVRLRERCGSDIRAVLHELYGVFQELSHIATV